jgi:predicted nucleic acid-binding protein
MAGKARVRVSGDRDLLALTGTRGPCKVLAVDAFCRQFLAVLKTATFVAKSAT